MKTPPFLSIPRIVFLVVCGWLWKELVCRDADSDTWTYHFWQTHRHSNAW